MHTKRERERCRERAKEIEKKVDKMKHIRRRTNEDKLDVAAAAAAPESVCVAGYVM